MPWSKGSRPISISPRIRPTKSPWSWPTTASIITAWKISWTTFAPPGNRGSCRFSTNSSAPSSKRSWAICSRNWKPSRHRGVRVASALPAFGHLTLDSHPQARLDVLGDGFGFHSFINLQSLQSRIDNDKAVGTFVHVRFEIGLDRGVYIGIEIIVQFLEKLFTGNQVD